MNKLKTYSIIITLITIILLITILSIIHTRKSQITKIEAQNIAYRYANVEKKDVTITKSNKELFDNEFEIEFIDNEYKYEFEIDSKTGRIINFEKDLINKVNDNNNNKENNSSNNNQNFSMDKEEAKKIVLKHVNLNEEDVTFTKINIDRESGKTVYELDFFDSENEYEICVDITTKEIVKYSKESLKLDVSNSNKYISLKNAKKLVLEHAKLKEKDIIWHKAELDIDYNIKTYEIEFFYNNLKYEYEIDAIDGNVLKYEIDRD